jgi:hypothetical protein
LLGRQRLELEDTVFSKLVRADKLDHVQSHLPSTSNFSKFRKNNVRTIERDASLDELKREKETAKAVRGMKFFNFLVSSSIFISDLSFVELKAQFHRNQLRDTVVARFRSVHSLTGVFNYKYCISQKLTPKLLTLLISLTPMQMQIPVTSCQLLKIIWLN